MYIYTYMFLHTHTSYIYVSRSKRQEDTHLGTIIPFHSSIYICIYIYIYTHTHTHKYEDTHLGTVTHYAVPCLPCSHRVFIHTCSCSYIHVLVHTYMFLFIHTCSCIHTCIT